MSKRKYPSGDIEQQIADRSYPHPFIGKKWVPPEQPCFSEEEILPRRTGHVIAQSSSNGDTEAKEARAQAET